MQFIKQHFTQTLEVKQSKFIAHLVPYNLYQSHLNFLKEEHPKARHFVTAYRYLNEFSQVVEHSSDDGEPKGTSGKPSLMVLQGKELIDTAVIIVRYFGGTKLGTGGLVRAYSDSVNLVIENAELFEYKRRVLKKIVLNYSDARMVDYECEKYEVTVESKSFESEIIYEISATQEQMNQFLDALERVVKVIT